MIFYKPIGIIHSPFKALTDMPIQPVGASEVKGEIEIFPEFAEGLKDLEGFSHIYIMYHFHQNKVARLTVKPFLDNNERGLFATRAPCRPNPIGLSLVRLISVEGNHLLIENIDALDGTPLLDIKPYVPGFESPEEVRTGWLDKKAIDARKHRSDHRFMQGTSLRDKE